MERSKRKRIWWNILKTLGILAACTLVAYLFYIAGLRTENLSMVYLVGVLLITVATGKIVYGIAAAVASVFAYNFFFTAPRFTFQVNDPNYIVTLIILLIGSFIASGLTGKLYRQTAAARRGVKQMKALYEISVGFLNLSGSGEIVMHGLNGLAKIQAAQCVVYTGADFTGAPQETVGKTPPMAKDNGAAKWCFENVKECGYGTQYFSEEGWLYLPLRSGNQVFGAAGVYCLQTPPTAEEMILIRTVTSQISEALEREALYREQEANRVKIEKEQLRNSLLRAVSHDLRTPLTGIAGSADFIAGNFKSLSEEQVVSLVEDIGKDAQWLTNMVENLLNMTRISDGGPPVQKRPEVIDDVVGEAYGRIAKYKGKRTIHVDMPDAVIEAPMDGRLIIQVLVNLLDNAIKYTQEDAIIRVRAYPDKEYMVFEVTDNGPGIDPEMINRIFDHFVSGTTKSMDAKRGIGIGLGICKSIVEAHGGMIAVENNESGGATFQFALPMR